MRIRNFLIPALILIAGCSKSNEEIDSNGGNVNNANNAKSKSAKQLLTQKQWKLFSAGFDDNKNGLVDDSENILAECQENDVYTFNNNGTGSVQDIGLTCVPKVIPDITWKLSNNDKELQVNFEHFSVLRLNESEMALSPNVPLRERFIFIYRH